MVPRRWLAAAVVSLLTVSGVSVVTTSGPASANGCITPAAGTALDPYLIQTNANLTCLKNNDAYYWHHGFHFKQTADLDMSVAAIWTHGIGDDTYTFDGTYDGNGKTITGLEVAGGTGVGMFGVTSAATLTNITLTDDSISGTTVVGGLVGNANDGTVISQSHVSGQVHSFGNMGGGLVGNAGDATEISHSSADVDVTLGFAVGAGGLVGRALSFTSPVIITYSSASGSAVAAGASGGLIGVGHAPLAIDHSYAIGDDTGYLAGAGGLAGLLVGDDANAITIDQSFATGRAWTNSGGAGGLVGEVDDQGTGTTDNTITNSYAAGSVYGTYIAGGVVGQVSANTAGDWTLTNTYSTGALSGVDDSTGGIVADMLNPGTAVVVASFWNPADSGASAASPYGTESTATAMRSSALYAGAGWDIAASAPDGSVWGSCPTINGGLPFLQWYAAQEGWVCTSTPPAPTPPGPPTSVTATAGDASATIAWQPPRASGSYPVSTYLATSSPGGRTCLVSALICQVTGLTNGATYTFTVQALSGAGWGPASDPSNAVTPRQADAPTIVITGSRGTGSQSRTVAVHGVTTGLVGQSVTPWVKVAGDASYAAAAARTVDAAGEFDWGRRTSRKVSVYVTSAAIRSNLVTIPARS